ncbi:toxic anion resistance protein [Acetobacterium sp.]|uniref:toxic anion resistance protein n=1 Tax=Acetobacterium sp. TaxID=1872094 RepID=UPI002F42FC60
MDDNANDYSQVTPSLTFDPFEEEKMVVAAQHQELAPEKQVFDESRLSPEERKMVDDFASKIDLNNSSLIMQFGVGAQKKIADFSETALNSVRTKDLGEVGKMLGDMVSELKNFDVEEEDKGFFGMFKKNINKLNSLQIKYAAAETNINHICESLEFHQVQLLKDVAMLDKLYEANKTYFKELSMYILAGKKKLKIVEDTDLPALIKKSELSGLPEDAQAVNDLSAMLNRFEKKIHDLELTRLISIQMAPQIRLVQHNDTLMAEKVQSSIVNTIPLWKSQMVLALGVVHSGQAAKAQREVTDMTNKLLRKNAETLKVESIAIARESERGIVDIDTLRYSNEALISTFDEVLQIQAEGRQKRKEVEAELQKLENDLKIKMQEIRR